MEHQAALPGFDVHRRPPTISVHEIQEQTAAHFRIPLIEMTSQRRARGVARPRQVAMYLAREKTPQSLPAIGRLFGNRDHSTVAHACKQIERLIGEDPAFASRVRELEGRL